VCCQTRRNEESKPYQLFEGCFDPIIPGRDHSQALRGLELEQQLKEFARNADAGAGIAPEDRDGGIVCLLDMQSLGN
jgi:hypothetical protein